MISSFRLKAGSVPGAPSQDITTTPITVFVGPNNSGKSKALSEIEYFCRNGQFNNDSVVLENLTISTISDAEAAKAIENIKKIPNEGESINAGHIIVGSKYNRMQVQYDQLLQFVRTPYHNIHAFCNWFLTHKTLMLDGRSRIDLVGQQNSGDLLMTPVTSLQVLFNDTVKRLEVRRIIKDAFGLYFVVDPTNTGYFRIRLASRPPNDEIEEQGYHPEARAFHRAAQLIDTASDGVKAFTGMITEIMAGDPKVILVDEPEAFLHPPLATQLGYEISRASIDADKRVFVSTHSPAFVMGCIQSGAPLNIVRLTYRHGVATSRILPSEEILSLMRNPLLRSTGVLNGLFYEFVVVTESDADRAFYQEINERLLRYKPEWGIPNCLFINAQNKQTVHTIIKPLRKLGIPAAGIVDIDALKEGGAPWTNLLEGGYVPEISRQGFANTRALIKNAFDATGKNMKREGGINLLEAGDKEAAEGLLRQLSEYGIFIIPGGELEVWLKDRGVTGKTPQWLIDMFENMGEDPDSATYLKPQENDVWLFLSRVREWMVNPNRLGIPS